MRNRKGMTPDERQGGKELRIVVEREIVIRMENLKLMRKKTTFGFFFIESSFSV